MLIDPKDLKERQIYNLMMSAILPRPIAWISTVNELGERNLAPFAYFMGVCCVPMTLLFCPVVPADGRAKKDTLRNIERVPEFVVNVSTESNASAINETAADLPYGESEFQLAGVTAIPSEAVRPFRVKEAPISFECTVRQIIEINAGPGGGWVVLGNVVRVHIDDLLLDGDSFQIPLHQLNPIGRLGGTQFVRTTDTFSMVRKGGLQKGV
jgi:flavin reductase (DIM6/NTAB) family NADH-FMN oxidoreductase RutF